MEQKINELKKSTLSAHVEVREKTISYITAAFGLVAGLAWNEAIKALIDVLFPLSKNSVVAKFIYAGLITVVVVFITTRLTRLSKKDNPEPEKK